MYDKAARHLQAAVMATQDDAVARKEAGEALHHTGLAETIFQR